MFIPMPVQVQGCCLQQKWGGSGSAEEDTSARMLLKLPCGAVGGGTRLLAGLRTRPCCPPRWELLAFTPVIAACLEMLLLKDQND